MFVGWLRPLVATAAVVLVTLVGGCGGETPGVVPPLPGVPYGSPVPPGQQNDPRVSAAAERVDPMLRRDFAATYGGLVLNHDAHTLVVYRKPDLALDARVHSQVKDVAVELRDARLSLREMRDLVSRVLADSSYWSQRGLMINGAGPKPDGSGIEVMTSTGASGEREELAERYGTDAITVTKMEFIPPIGQPWTPPPSPTPTRS